NPHSLVDDISNNTDTSSAVKTEEGMMKAADNCKTKLCALALTSASHETGITTHY
ncbi:hypothetical protein L9F63_006798, partial [Diploptera punctata]